MKVCGNCIHLSACNGWNHGSMENTNAEHCVNYETLKGSTAYYIGYSDATNKCSEELRKLCGVLEDLKIELLCK